MPEPNLVSLVADSLSALRKEAPEASLRLRRALGARAVRFRIGEDRFCIHRSGSELVLALHGPAPTVEVEATWAVVVDVVEGRRSLVEALLEGHIDAVGAPEDVAAVYDGLLEYVRGAARGPSFPGMWAELRRAVMGVPAVAAPRAWRSEFPS